MHFLSKPTALLAVTWLLGVGAAPALAAETTTSEIVIVRPGDVVDDDLYAAAVRVLIEGEVNGDLVVLAAEEVVIMGTVTGSVIAVAPTVEVDGTVGGSLRSVASDLRVGGEVGGDVVAGGLDVALEPGSRGGGDVLVWASALTTSGVIEGDLGGSQRRLRLGGSVGGEVDISVDRLTIADSVSVTGDLGYRSEREAEGIERAEVGGSVVHRTPLPPQHPGSGTGTVRASDGCRLHGAERHGHRLLVAGTSAGRGGSIGGVSPSQLAVGGIASLLPVAPFRHRGGDSGLGAARHRLAPASDHGAHDACHCRPGPGRRTGGGGLGCRHGGSVLVEQARSLRRGPGRVPFGRDRLARSRVRLAGAAGTASLGSRGLAPLGSRSNPDTRDHGIVSP